MRLSSGIESSKIRGPERGHSEICPMRKRPSGKMARQVLALLRGRSTFVYWSFTTNDGGGGPCADTAKGTVTATSKANDSVRIADPLDHVNKSPSIDRCAWATIRTCHPNSHFSRQFARDNNAGVASLATPLGILPEKPFYSSTKMFLLAHISFRIFGHTVTLTSPRWALRSNSIKVRDCPIPPPIESGIWLFRMAW